MACRVARGLAACARRPPSPDPGHRGVGGGRGRWGWPRWMSRGSAVLAVAAGLLTGGQAHLTMLLSNQVLMVASCGPTRDRRAIGISGTPRGYVYVSLSERDRRQHAATWQQCSRPGLRGIPIPATSKDAVASRVYRGDGACHAVAETGRADAECEVESAAHVLQCYVVGQFHDLAVVKMLVKPVEQFAGDVDGSAAHADGVVQDELVELGEQRACLIAGEGQDLLIGQAPPAGDRRAHVDAVLAVGEGGRLQLGEGVQPPVQTGPPVRGLLDRKS